MPYRRLKEGEQVLPTDEIFTPKKGEGYGWNAECEWVVVGESGAGCLAPDPAYPAHRQYRRRIETEGDGDEN